ncbi:MAG: hypothetical protein ACYDDS_06100, partial [Candidatus Sulfotelmatobacter sp.]
MAERWGDVYKPEFAVDAREIPRPAGEYAGLRDDAFIEDSCIQNQRGASEFATEFMSTGRTWRSGGVTSISLSSPLMRARSLAPLEKTQGFG